ncbi:M1 family metallopeptidase [Candidatus Solirubrobacter pratensis]|uniref:M1 family metallopeptidase n=1 Tax=Candidatus Solirubrobacter pratensis TaxID=1298857 RepID=UPI00042922AA|nr:M1 family metallopeptidase [Candidatus Solirubrobacter pratensis]
MRRPFVLALAVLAILAAPARAASPSPGAAGLGDRLFPQLGNGGYDALHYDLDLRYATSAPSQAVDGTVTMLARASQSLSSFDLDFAGQSVGSVAVDGKPAAWRRDGEDIVITPRKPLRAGARFLVTVANYTAVPTEPDPADGATEAFFVHSAGSATAGQPNWAHYFLPSNDHPRDKATFDIRFDVPAGQTAVANGVLAAKWTDRGRAHFIYVQRQPMATELIQLAVGQYDVTNLGVHSGVFLRDVTAKPITARINPLLDVTPAQIDWMQARVGSYPFDTYGSLVVEADLGFALETQTLELIDTSWFDDYSQGVWEPTLLHEMSHMWFGDSVAPYSWSDLWLNEGHASWYEFLYAEEKGELADDTEGYPDDTGYASVDDLMRAVYAHGDQWRADDGPVAAPKSADTLFSFQVYHGGALVLYALRQVVGAATFQRIERAWLQRYEGRSASTDDFIALASQVSGRDLTGFLRDWLYGTKTPPMPGHPDWTVDPVAAPAPAPTALSAPLSPRHPRLK